MRRSQTDLVVEEAGEAAVGTYVANKVGELVAGQREALDWSVGRAGSATVAPLQGAQDAGGFWE